MSTQAQLSSQVLEQAAEWFAKLRAANIGEAEREEFFLWLMQSPDHVQAYVQEALAHSDTLTICDRVSGRLEEPCSAARLRKVRDGNRRA